VNYVANTPNISVNLQDCDTLNYAGQLD